MATELQFYDCIKRDWVSQKGKEKRDPEAGRSMRS